MMVVLAIVFLGACAVILFNVTIDIFGLFRPVKGRVLPVYHSERISKYLLSLRYIPQNFDTVIIGTSLSDNLDVTPRDSNLDTRFRMYNASVMGANIFDIYPIAKNVIEGGVKNMIICLSPYMMKVSSVKRKMPDTGWWRWALGNKKLYETYLVTMIRQLGLKPRKYPKNQFNGYGVNDYYSLFEVKDIHTKIDEVIEDNKDKKLIIDPVAVQTLMDLVKLLKTKQVNYVIYFHPVPERILKSKKEDYEKFSLLINSLIQDCKIIDFNSAAYNYFTTDYSNYLDHGHLSRQGQARLMQLLYHELSGRCSDKPLRSAMTA